MSALVKYTTAKNAADSVRKIERHACQVIEGSNDGYFIEAFGWSYRFASVNEPSVIAQLFLDIVSVGPVEQVV